MQLVADHNLRVHEPRYVSAFPRACDAHHGNNYVVGADPINNSERNLGLVNLLT